MADLISRAAAIAQIKENYCNWCDHTDLCQSCETRDCIATIEQHLPAVDAAPVVHGRWMNIPDKPEWDQKMCSVCGDYFCCQGNYCPNCGARMDGERRDDKCQG